MSLRQSKELLAGICGDSDAERLRLRLLAEIAELHTAGVPMRRIAAACGVGPATILRCRNGTKEDFRLSEAAHFESGIRRVRAEIEAARELATL